MCTWDFNLEQEGFQQMNRKGDVEISLICHCCVGKHQDRKPQT